MKQIAFLCLLLSTSFGFSQEYNYKFCRERVTTQQESAQRTKFNVTSSFSVETFHQISEMLYAKDRIYSVKTNDTRTELYVYHLSDLVAEDLLLIIESVPVKFYFLSTTNVEFRDENKVINFQNGER